MDHDTASNLMYFTPVKRLTILEPMDRRAEVDALILLDMERHEAAHAVLGGESPGDLLTVRASNLERCAMSHALLATTDLDAPFN